MKKLIILFFLIVFGYAHYAQHVNYRKHLKAAKAFQNLQIEPSFKGAYIPGKPPAPIPSKNYKSQDDISIIDIGTSANVFGYGFDGGQRSLVCANEELGVVTNFSQDGR
ncbi:MAG: hypothetical protein B6D64_01580 [Bacteroidetes bacterium 4484_276]|nr:MAG: hypothetical protein B6D64_01580 [Bacteroidetes bacterium 4484_276]